MYSGASPRSAWYVITNIWYNNVFSVLWEFAFGFTLCCIETHPLSPTPQKSQSDRHSAVNMKAVHHEWFWRRKKFLPLLFEHWRSGQTEVMSHRNTAASQFMAEHLYSAGLLYITDTNRKSGSNYTVKYSHVHTFDNHKRLSACSYLINMTGFMDVSG